MSDQRTVTVMVVLPDGVRADWLRIVQILTWHGWPAAVPLLAFPIRRGRIVGWVSRWLSRHLLDGARHHGAVTHAVGGRRSRLDLDRMSTTARTEAAASWWTWNTYIARTTRPAKPWEEFLTEQHRDPDKLTLVEARRRFETQPRVLAMLAHNSYPAARMVLNPDELAEFQAGEAVYIALHWHHAMTGDALITPDGRLLEPASASIADRLRYFADAARVITDLHPTQHLVAVKAAPAP